MKQQERKSLGSGVSTPPTLSELRNLRMQQKAMNQRVEELKLRLFRLTERHMEQAVSLIRRWMDDKAK